VASLAAVSALALGLLPVLTFLLVLQALDSFKLVRLRAVLRLLLAGAGVALICFFLNRSLASLLQLDLRSLARYVAPVTEEGLKGLVLVWLIWRHRVGFLVDAAVCGFAVGAGFAAAENLHYFVTLDEPHLALWVVRGFGTAIMHGALTAMMAVVSRFLVDLRSPKDPTAYLPGLLGAIVLHSLFNHFFLSPIQSALVLLLGLPLLFSLVFRASEEATRRWLGVGFDTDSELLESINTGTVSETRVGEYLMSLKERFAPEIVTDMLCLVRLQLELSLQAKGLLMAREAGFDLEPNPEAMHHLEELEYLEGAIGRTGMLALEPVLNVSSRELWQIFLLTEG
jgi:RsiW-degrading membrane proteinase PrsW (M82 family)